MTLDPYSQAAAEQVERLRALRVRHRERGMHALFAAAQERFTRQAKRGGSAAEAWNEVCPPEFLPKTAIEGLRAGVLRVRVGDASTLHRLDRFLRAGGERQLTRASRAPIRKVKLSLGPVEQSP